MTALDYVRAANAGDPRHIVYRLDDPLWPVQLLAALFIMEAVVAAPFAVGASLVLDRPAWGVIAGLGTAAALNIQRCVLECFA